MSTPSKRGLGLAAALNKASGLKAPAEPEAPAPVETAPAEAPRRPLKSLQLFVSAEDHDRLKDLSHHSRTSLQQLGIEAWNLLLEKRGHAPLSPTTVARPSGRLRT